MGKPPEIIEGEYRVLSKTGKAPFWGPNAGVMNTLSALCSAGTMMSYSSGPEPHTSHWRAGLVLWAIIAIIAFALAGLR